MKWVDVPGAESPCLSSSHHDYTIAVRKAVGIGLEVDSSYSEHSSSMYSISVRDRLEHGLLPHTAFLTTSSFACSSFSAAVMCPFAPRPPVPSRRASATASSTSVTANGQCPRYSCRNQLADSPAYSASPSSPTQYRIFSLWNCSRVSVHS